MLSFDEALVAILGAAQPIGVERVSVDHAAGRILAAPVLAEVDSPSSDVSAMDGYAVRESDPSPYRLIGASYPGRSFAGALCSGECVRIFTGASVPEGADRVIIQELVRCSGDLVSVDRDFGKARHIRSQGTDFVSGDQLLSPGRHLDPRALVAAAAADIAEIEVFRRPTVAVLATGDELVAPGTAKHRAGSIPESVSLGIAALVEKCGGHCLYRLRVADDLEETQAAAAKAFDKADLLVVTGGASIGEKDFAKAALGNLGSELIFSKVAIKPGKPVWLGRARGRLVMGLPGNPTSALVTGRLLLAPLVSRLAGQEPTMRWQRALLAEPLTAVGDRETFVRGRWRGVDVEPIDNQDSGAQGGLAEAELLIRRPAGSGAMAAGEWVDVIDF